MNDKMITTEAALTEAVGQLEDLAEEARQTQSRHAGAIAVLTMMAEALLPATQEVARLVRAETVEAGGAGKPV